MPSVLGKRKIRSAQQQQEEEESTAAAALAEAQAVFRRHFEARFKPLPDEVLPPLPTSNGRNEEDGEDGEEEDDDEEWGGVSDEEDENSEAERVQVVDHSGSSASASVTSSMTKRELKAYMSSRPPIAQAESQTKGKSKGKRENENDPDGDEPEDSATLLANDLALQRLIAESHILSAAGANPSHYHPSASSASSSSSAFGAGTDPESERKKALFAAGRTRLLTTDLRLRQVLGSAVDTGAAQTRMPMAMRKGIVAAADSREKKRRKEARENGVVLERATSTSTSTSAKNKNKVQKKTKRKGERPVDVPAVGKMRGAELRLSARDVRSIQGSGSGSGTGRGGGLKGVRYGKRRR